MSDDRDDLPTDPEPGRSGEPIIPGTFLPNDPIQRRYRDLGPIGQGGMGEVRRVLDRHLDRVLAMKILSSQLLYDESSVRRFQNEARITAGLQHPGIVAVHDHGDLIDGRLWMTMREVRGRTMSDVIHELHQSVRGEAWPEGETGPTLFRVIDTFRRLCDGVAYAHSRGVVHRDLKPANLMVGEFGEVQVMDWGLAKRFGEGEVKGESLPPLDPTMTQAGDVIGTPAYMSPEQARGDLELVGPPSDVWSLGAVMRKILTNKPPVEGTSPIVIAQIILGQVKPIRETLEPWTPALPEELVAIAERAMAPKIEDRYADAGALADDLGAWLEGARRRKSALAIVESASQREPEIHRLRDEAAELRERAIASLRALPPAAPAEAKYEGWELEDQAADRERSASLLEVEWLQQLRGALEAAPDLPEAHQRLADHYKDRLLDAEARRDPDEAARSEALLRSHDRGRHAKFLAGNGAVTLITDPPGAKVTAYRYVEERRRLVPKKHAVLGVTPIREAALPHGSYLLVAELEGYAPVRYPVLIERAAHWDGVPPGESEPEPIRVLTANEIGEGFVYVPAGWFISGGDPHAPDSLPRRRLWADAFVMGVHPVTNGEYLAYLNDLIANDQRALAMARAPRSSQGGEEDSHDAIPYGRSRDGSLTLPPRSEWSASYPVAMIDWHAAVAYAEWSGRDHRLETRLPDELEWEKAARGVDARACAFGHHVEPTWAGVMAKGQRGPGRASIDAHPIDESPFGVRGMTGNVRDWCGNAWSVNGPPTEGHRIRPNAVAPQETAAGRGGAWHSVPELARAATRFGAGPDGRYSVVGFRLARSVPGRLLK
ncbi:MAG: SUMF1/EgtB/PvdO family nonheme iron enzyme [Sandaracinaceae bacterium]|nr:MAG: protein kinase [Sandaracinaceae bacterium]